jgi:hypothetical protein
MRAACRALALRGLDYIDEVVQVFYNGSWSDAFRAFVEDDANIWCPTWIRRTHKVLNDNVDKATADSEIVPATKVEVGKADSCRRGRPRPTEKDTPKVKFVFEEDGEPQQDEEEQAATTLDAWDKVRAPWERHSELGPNLRPVGRVGETAPWIPQINPANYAWDARWDDVDVEALRRMFDARKQLDVEHDRPDLSRDRLGDDYQQLFVDILLQRAQKILDAPEDALVPPLRIMLLGTAGTGKSTTIQTALQEIKTLLRERGLPADFVRVGAPTGCAAFNIRFGASTLRRLFALANPARWSELKEGGQSLLSFQAKFQNTKLVLVDEVSMVGKQFMGRDCQQMQAG